MLTTAKLKGIELVESVEKEILDNIADNNGEIDCEQFKRLIEDEEICDILARKAEKHESGNEFLPLTLFFDRNKFKENMLSFATRISPQNNPFLLNNGELKTLRNALTEISCGFEAEFPLYPIEEATTQNIPKKDFHHALEKKKSVSNAMTKQERKKLVAQFPPRYQDYVEQHADQITNSTQTLYAAKIKNRSVEFRDPSATVYITQHGSAIYAERFNVYFNQIPIATSATVTYFPLNINDEPAPPIVLTRKMYVWDETSELFFDENFKPDIVVPRNNQEEAEYEVYDEELNYVSKANAKHLPKKFTLICKLLQDEINKNPNDPLFKSAENILTNAIRAKSNYEVRGEEFPKLNKFLESTLEVLKESRNVSAADKISNVSLDSDDENAYLVNGSRKPDQSKSFYNSKVAYLDQAIGNYKKNLEEIESINRWKRIQGAGAIFFGEALSRVFHIVAMTNFGPAALISAAGLELCDRLIDSGRAIEKNNLYNLGNDFYGKASGFKSSVKAQDMNSDSDLNSLSLKKLIS